MRQVFEILNKTLFTGIGSLFSQKNHRRLTIAGIVVFAFMGSLLLYRSFASEELTIAREAEQAVAVGVSVEYDAEASQELFVKFVGGDCPEGTSGTPPNCFELQCPEGQTGTPPNCTSPPPTPDFTTQRLAQVTSFAYPLHYLDTFWSPGTMFERVEIDVRPEVAVVSSDAYYVSNTVFFPMQPSCDPNCIAYMGLQTDGNDGRPGAGRVGKMAIFSMWGASGEAVAGPGAWVVPFDGEGEGYSVRVPYEWQVNNTYRFVMYRDEAVVPGTTYWTAYIIHVETNQWTHIGSIRAPAGLQNASSFATFHEIYWGGADCTSVSPSQVFMSNARVVLNGVWYDVRKRDHYQANVNGCNSTFWVNDYDGSNGFRSGINTSPM